MDGVVYTGLRCGLLGVEERGVVWMNDGFVHSRSGARVRAVGGSGNPESDYENAQQGLFGLLHSSQPLLLSRIF